MRGVRATASQGSPVIFMRCHMVLLMALRGSTMTGEAWGNHLLVKCSWTQLQNSVISAVRRLRQKEFEVSLSYALKPVSKQMTQVQIRKRLVAKGQKDLQSLLPI